MKQGEERSKNGRSGEKLPGPLFLMVMDFNTVIWESAAYLLQACHLFSHQSVLIYFHMGSVDNVCGKGMCGGLRLSVRWRGVRGGSSVTF